MSKKLITAIDIFDKLDNYYNEQNDAVDDDVEESTLVDKFCYTPNLQSDQKIYITKSGAFIKFSNISESSALLEKYIKRIDNYFTLKVKLLLGHIKQIKRCKIDRKKSRIIVPRFGIFEILDDKFGLGSFTTVNQIKPGNSPDDPNTFTWTGKLTDNQQLISDYIMRNIYTDQRVACGSAGLILDLEAGQGKSYLAAYLMSVIKKKTIIVVHSTNMIEQWSKVLINCFPNISIGYYYTKKKKIGDVMLMVVDSACRSSFIFKNKVTKIITEINAIEFYNNYGFVIYDECHEYCNQHDAKAFRTAQAPYVLGLSATPDENINKFDTLVWWEIGPILCAEDLPGYRATTNDFKATVHRMMYYGSPDYTRSIILNIVNGKTDITSNSETISMICSDENRSRLVIKCVLECLKKNLYTYVFAERREYLELLRSMLIEEMQGNQPDDLSAIVTDENDFIRLVGGSKSNELEVAEVKSKVIFTTYQFGGTGRSIIKMNGLVLATPRKSKMKQYIKRIFRLGSDASIERHIYDIVDQKLKLKNQWPIRKKYYDNMQYTIVEEKIYHTDKQLAGGVDKTICKLNNKTRDSVNNVGNPTYDSANDSTNESGNTTRDSTNDSTNELGNTTHDSTNNTIDNSNKSTDMTNRKKNTSKLPDYSKFTKAIMKKLME